MTEAEMNFMSDLSLTFDILDDRRWLCFNLAAGRTLEETYANVHDWRIEMNKAEIGFYRGSEARNVNSTQNSIPAPAKKKWFW